MSKKKISKYELMNPKVLSRIVFPEIQVLDYVKCTGIIKKDLFKKKYKMASKISFNGKSKIGNNIKKAVNNTVQATEQAVNTVGSNVKTSSCVNVHSDYVRNNKTREELDIAFQSVENTLSEYVLGQKDLIRNLCIAFKRPFAYGNEGGISNIIFITGAMGSGRHLAVKAITKFLKQNKVLKKSGVMSLDLAKYKLEKDADNLFLPDLYKGLYGEEPVIVFDNFDKCHSSVLDTIIKLGIDEKLKLNKRYVDQIDQMLDVTGKGMLTLNTTDEILANGKYIIFITEKTENEIKTIFPSKFMAKVYDIIRSEALDDEVLSTIASYILEDYKNKIKEKLAFSISFDPSVLKYVVKNSEKSSGAHSLKKYTEENIYKPIADLQLNGKIYKNEFYTLSYNKNRLILSDGINTFGLVDTRKRADNEELEQLDKELDNIIGLDNVKCFIKGLKDNIKIQNLRRNQGEKEAKLSLHMIFTGNPGTGKTTMARIMAKYLKALGYLSSGHLVEVSRNDLVGQYIGETAQKTMAKVNSAKGGILFIDEAYSLARDSNDIFGIEAVDSLVKAVEDNRNDLVVILAGYSKEMEEFLKTNSGLKSRFNYNIEFLDYSPEELLEILKVVAKQNGYNIDLELDEKLLELFEKKQIKGKNDSGNGRLARNMVEEAIANQSKRLASMNKTQIDKKELNNLILSDFGLDNDNEDFDLEANLSEIIGLEEVKNFVRDLKKQLIAKEKRKKLGVNIDSSQSLNMIFTGNPGTGKTTVARLIAQLMNEMGILKSGQVIETDRSGIVGQFVGETTKKMNEVFKSALGGILFIDEAYSLMSSNNDPLGKEAVDTLVKLVEDYREDTIVILAGYEKEMNGFLKSNSGLKSRFPLKIQFADYNIDELLEIGKSIIKNKGFILSSDAEDELKALIEQRRNNGSNNGNGRLVRNIVEEAIRKQSSRIAEMEDINERDVVLLIDKDFGESIKTQNDFDLQTKLDEIVGLDEVKDFIKSLQAQIKIKKQRKSLGLPVDEGQTLHMIFKGNPGTGKTTMARILGEVFYNLGVLKSKKFLETDRSGLVAGYVGQTALKTKEKIESAIGGILFIDEAYALAQDANSGSGFGKEAIDTLVKEMDDNRENLVVILAGYNDDMNKFLDVNPGLKSRFANVVEFKDYSVNELLIIAKNLFKSKGYVISNEAREKMKQVFEEAVKHSDFGNGRYVRNIFEQSTRNQAVRLESIGNLTKNQLITIEAEDIL